jgi:adenylate kinase
MVDTLILLGPPGSGKGTQAALLRDELGFELLSTGALLRAAREAGTETGRRAAAFMDRGDLVPDDVVATVVEHAIAELAGRRVILDGFPRTVAQARSLDGALGERRVDAVVLIDVPDEEVVRRIADRRQGRSDDTAETARARLRVYHRETEPLAAHYGERGLLRRVDGAGAPDSVAAEIRAAIA